MTLPPFQRTSETSREAAIAQLPKLGNAQAQYMRYMRECGPLGATDHEAADRIGRPLSSICARRNEMKRHGYIEDSGHRRPTRYGGRAVVWRVTEAGSKEEVTMKGGNHHEKLVPFTEGDRDLIEAWCEMHRISMSELSKRAGLASTTINQIVRRVNQKSVAGILADTKQRILAAMSEVGRGDNPL